MMSAKRNIHISTTELFGSQFESRTYGCDLDPGLALFPVGDAFLNLPFHRVGPLVGLNLTDLNVLALSPAKVLLEILDLGSSTMRVSELDDRARV